MAIRRPRIKPVANISLAKKKRSDTSETKDKEEVKNVFVLKEENKLEENYDKITNLLHPEEGFKNENELEVSSQLKCSNITNFPAKTLSNDIIQKPRQRIRPTPCFDFRRNNVTNPLGNSLNSHTSINEIFLNNSDSNDKPTSKEILHLKHNSQYGNRSPNTNRHHRVSESSSGGFLSPTSVHHHSPLSHYNHNNQQSNNNIQQSGHLCGPPSKDHIPPRYRKISAMDDTQKLSSARKEYQSKYSHKSPEKATLKLCDFIFYNPTSNPMVFESKQENIDIDTDTENLDTSVDTTKTKECEVENKEKEEERAPVPQLKLGPNGEIILDEKSLVIETTAEKQARSVLASKSAIYLDEYSGNNGFYSRQKRTKDWTPEETIKFYRCLHTIGTDFSMMLSLFPNRSRRDLKLKFKKEERNNGSLINKALLQPNAFDIETLKEELEREEKIAEEKRIADTERKLNFQKKIENKILNYANDGKSESYRKRDKNHYSQAKNTLTNGDLAYEMESTLVTNKQKIRKIKSKQNDECAKNELSEIFKNDIKNEKVIKDDTYVERSINEIIDDVTVSDFDDLLSVNSINELAYDESHDVEITDIGDILTLEDTLPQFKNSTLAIVSKNFKGKPEEVVHGIYIICRSTGIMSQKPLDLPEETVNCILKAMGKI